MQDNHTQLLVHKSHQEMIFQVAQHNPMAGDMCFDKTLEQIMSRIYRPGIQGRCVPVVGTLSVSRSSSDFVPFTFNAGPWALKVMSCTITVCKCYNNNTQTV